MESCFLEYAPIFGVVARAGTVVKNCVRYHYCFMDRVFSGKIARRIKINVRGSPEL